MPDPTDLIGSNFCSGHGEVVTAHEESLKIPVQLYSGLILLCETEFKRKIKNCKQTWKYLNAWRPLKGAIHAILCLLGVFTWYFSFCEIKDLSWLERHTVRQVHIASATWACLPFLNWHVLLLRFDLHNIILPLNLCNWSLKSRFGWKSHSLMTMMFTRYFLFRKELYEKCQTRPYICKVSEAVEKCSLLFLLFIMIWVNELE